MTTTNHTRPSKLNLSYYWFFFGIIFILGFFSLRFISVWWINPILYGVITIACFYVMVRFVWYHRWKHLIVIIMFICTLLSSWNSLVSLSEIGNCWVEDIRYTQLIVCKNGNKYQQIESLPIGMRGYCYYCPWY